MRWWKERIKIKNQQSIVDGQKTDMEEKEAKWITTKVDPLGDQEQGYVLNGV